MTEQNRFKIDKLNLDTFGTTGDREKVNMDVSVSLSKLADIITDPTTEHATITAVVRGGDNSINLCQITLDHRDTEISNQNADYYSWQHALPEAALNFYDEISTAIGVYCDDESEPEDNFETSRISIGDPSSGFILTNQPTTNLNQALFANVEQDIDIEEQEGEDDD